MIRYILENIEQEIYIIPDIVNEIYITKSSIDHLILSKDCRIIQGVDNIIKKITLNSKLVFLCLANSGIEDIIFATLENYKKLYIINIKNNPIKDPSIKAKLKEICDIYEE